MLSIHAPMNKSYVMFDLDLLGIPRKSEPRNRCNIGLKGSGGKVGLGFTRMPIAPNTYMYTTINCWSLQRKIITLLNCVKLGLKTLSVPLVFC